MHEETVEVMEQPACDVCRASHTDEETTLLRVPAGLFVPLTSFLPVQCVKISQVSQTAPI